MKNMIKSIVAGLVLALVPLAALASDYVPTDVAWLVTGTGDTNPTNWPGAGKWKIDGAATPLDTDISSTQDYGVKDDKALRPVVKTSTFSGKSLSVGALDGSSKGSVLFRTPDNAGFTTFANEGLFLYAGGLTCWNERKQTIYGRVTVRSPKTAAASMVGTAAGCEFTFSCPVESDSDAGLFLYSVASSSDSMTQTNFVCRFLGNALANYNGSIECCPVHYSGRNTVSWYTKTNYNAKLKPPYYFTFKTDTGTMPGSLTLYPNAIIAAETSTTDFSVGSLSSVSLNGYGTNYLSVAMAADGSTCSVLRVTGTLDLQSPMAIRLSMVNKPIMAAAERLAILKAPSGVTLDLAKFFLDRDDTLPYLPDYELDVSTDAGDGLSTLWLVRSRPVVWTLAGDPAGSTFYTRSDIWSDNAAASNIKDYVTTNAIRTPAKNDTGAKEFPGHSLSMSNGTLNLCSPVVRIGDLRIWKGVIANLLNGNSSFKFMEGIRNSTWVLEGDIRIATDGRLILYCYNSKVMRIDSDISGGGVFEVQNQAQGNAVTITDSPKKAFIGLFGSNADFKGKIQMRNIVTTTLDAREGSNLAITNACNLGGPLASWTYDALQLQNCCGLHPLKSLTLDDATRGIHLSGNYAFFTVTNDVVFTCKERITRDGTLIKDGAGELALGGPQPYFHTAGSTIPTAARNVLDIWDGTLRPVSAAAFQGLAVVITNANATLAIDVPVSNDDGDIGQYGMLDTTWDAPLTVPAGGLTVQLRDTNGVLAGRKGISRVPICTVNATARSALDGKLSVSPQSSDYVVTSTGWTDNGDNTFTFAANVRRNIGFRLIFR